MFTAPSVHEAPNSDVRPLQAIDSQPQLPLRDRRHSVSVPARMHKLQNSSEETPLNEGIATKGSHPDLLIASSGSDFELAYEKAGLRWKETSPVEQASEDVGESVKFQVGGKSDIEGEDHNINEKTEDTDVETLQSPEEVDPALKAAVHRLTKAIQLSESVSENQSKCLFPEKFVRNSFGTSSIAIRRNQRDLGGKCPLAVLCLRLYLIKT